MIQLLFGIKKNYVAGLVCCGTACKAEEAQWIDNNEVLIMGFS
ncbi:MAG: hypothetical protein SVU94_07860 [Bacteroidota bacterium]|nr:hypothetical protein [Bacteroidota bacterium]